MPNLSPLLFFAALFAALLIWGRALWYFDEHSDWPRRLTFSLMGYTRLGAAEVKSLLFTVIYCFLGLAASLLFWPTGSRLFHFSLKDFELSILGIVAEISLANLLVDAVARALHSSPERFVEIQEIPWIKGLRALPAFYVPIAAAVAGIVEELFFRGALIGALISRGLTPPVLAICLSGLLFALQQLIQVRTLFQALVIGVGCLSISIVGGCLVVFTGSVVPAILGHGSFVIFFMSRGGEAPALARS